MEHPAVSDFDLKIMVRSPLFSYGLPIAKGWRLDIRTDGIVTSGKVYASFC
jgi:hypothetical protein